MTTTVTTTVTMPDAEALRDHLDGLNEAGTTPISVGIDANGSPFLITLVGPYVESEDVFFDSPWQGDRDYGERIDGEWVAKKPHCEECRAMVHGINDIKYPRRLGQVRAGQPPQRSPVPLLQPRAEACPAYPEAGVGVGG